MVCLIIEEKEKLIKRVIEDGISVAQACRSFNVSRPTFYKWYKKYEKGNGKLSSLRRKRAGKKQTPFDQEKLIIDFVVKHPDYSKYQLAEELKKLLGKKAIGLGGVYNVLKRYSLNTYEKRLVYAQDHQLSVITWLSSALDWFKPVFGRIPVISAKPPPYLKV